jgi:serine/threonine protein kinase
MGEVHLATLEREAGFRKRVAIKRALPQLASDPRVAERFEREARLSAVLAHRHIVQVFDFGRADGAAWLAMEYVSGVDLKAVQDRLGVQPLPAGVALEIGLACAAGLHHAHGARDAAGVPMRLVHRDVSPHNVLLSFDGDVKLTDFGLAGAATGPDGPDGLIQGKYAYMSPEQARGGAVDARSDQYALGVVLYELLSGARAFQGFEGPLATLDRVAAGRPLRPLADLGVAPALVAVVARAMAVDAEARYPDMQHFAAALRAGAQGAGVVPGEPPLGDWLREVFPERATASMEHGPPSTPPSPTEVTAAALAPIAAGSPPAGLERTLDAVSPAALEHTVDAAAPPARGGPFPELPPPTASPTARSESNRPGAVPGRRWWPWSVPVLLLAGGLALWATTRPVEVPESDPRSMAAEAELPAPRPSARPSETAVAAAPRPPSAPPPASAAAASASPPPPAVVVPSAGVRPSIDARPSRPPPSAPSKSPSSSSPAPPSSPPSDSPPPSPPSDSPPPSAPSDSPPPPAPVVDGPRVRLSAEGARVRDAAGEALATWRPLAGGSVLAQVIGGTGPPVSVRLLASGRLVRANVTARPHGEVRLDGVALGGTPLADIPLRAGRRSLVVRAPDGSETRVTIEVAVDAQDARETLQ